MIRRFFFLAAMLLAGTAGAVTLDQTYDRTFDVRPGARVTLDNVNGRVAVTSWNQPRVRVRAVCHVEGRDDAAARKAMAQLVNVSADGGGLRVHTVYPRSKDGFFDWLAGTNVHANVIYEITVPRTMSLDVSSVNGALTASDVTGALKLSTTNGRITVDRCGGELNAGTTNGAITADLVAVSAGRPISLSTTNGRISLTVPRTLAARLDAATTNGAISSDVPVTTDGSSPHALRGTMNGGGPAEVRLRTTNGAIEIKAR